MQQDALTRPHMSDSTDHSDHAAALAEREATYAERCARLAPLRDTYNRRAGTAANLNVVLFLGALVCFGLGFWRAGFFALAGVLIVAFIASFVYQGRLERMRERYALLWQLNAEGGLRLRRDWAALPAAQLEPSDGPQPPLVADLDLAGRASLLHLLGTNQTPIGRATLRSWLLRPAAPAQARERQRAVAELAPALDDRDELAVRGRLLGQTSQANYEAFTRWAESPDWVTPRAGLLWAARLLPLLTLALLIAEIVGAIPYPFWLVTFAVSIYVGETPGKPAQALVTTVAEHQTAYEEYADLFGLLAARNDEAPLLRALHSRLAAEGPRADEQMRRLARILILARLRDSIYLAPLRLAVLLDVHVLWLLERWKRGAGRAARGWLETLGEMEALSALATLAYDHPWWTFPELTDAGVEGAPRLIARNLAHPLLPPATAVGNDVEIGPPGTFLLVTGSNMSGKSTLLRAIGLNVVLAQAGGPVAAEALRLPPLALATSMRISDSLEQGVSYFLAELQRLKQVVEEARSISAQGDRTLLFLLDEILHGTNTAERQIAARRILRQLLAFAATGAISTHDLALADAVEIATTATLVHFTEQFTRGPEGPSMRFDYHLRPGLATSTNALKLMEIVGLDVSDDDGDRLGR